MSYPNTQDNPASAIPVQIVVGGNFTAAGNGVPVVISSSTGTTTQTGGNVTTHGTFQTVLAANPARKGALIQNTSSDTLYVFFGNVSSATEAASFQIGNLQSLSANAGSLVLTDEIAITSKTTDGATYVLAHQ